MDRRLGVAALPQAVLCCGCLGMERGFSLLLPPFSERGGCIWRVLPSLCCWPPYVELGLIIFFLGAGAGTVCAEGQPPLLLLVPLLLSPGVLMGNAWQH